MNHSQYSPTVSVKILRKSKNIFVNTRKVDNKVKPLNDANLDVYNVFCSTNLQGALLRVSGPELTNCVTFFAYDLEIV